MDPTRFQDNTKHINVNAISSDAVHITVNVHSSHIDLQT